MCTTTVDQESEQTSVRALRSLTARTAPARVLGLHPGGHQGGTCAREVLLTGGA